MREIIRLKFQPEVPPRWSSAIGWHLLCYVMRRMSQVWLREPRIPDSRPHEASHVSYIQRHPDDDEDWELTDSGRNSLGIGRESIAGGICVCPALIIPRFGYACGLRQVQKRQVDEGNAELIQWMEGGDGNWQLPIIDEHLAITRASTMGKLSLHSPGQAMISSHMVRRTTLRG
ncbi:hypothetical protein FE257_003191 [Aspergillus nanangensis]|uniref:Uncharacterized protein n=1 Tax=Aspergillus nanangensis TaxID=2582783 RepID=A0AAD4CC44_ASPNN|nr:hypothetical protein FE257_003191 [Aspergillus nanangensis]